MAGNFGLCVTGQISPDITSIDLVPKWPAGFKFTDGNGTVWQYVKAGATGPTANLLYQIIVTYNFTTGLATYTLGTTGLAYAATQGIKCGVHNNGQTWTLSYYGFIAVAGPLQCYGTSAITAGQACYTSTTVGEILPQTATQNRIMGLYCITDPAGHALCPCFATGEMYTGPVGV